MAGRRQRIVASDGEEDGSPLHSPVEETEEGGKRRKLLIDDSPPDEEEKARKIRKVLFDEEEDEGKDVSPPSNSDDDEEEEDEEDSDYVKANPIGNVIRVSGKGGSRRKHYKEFEFDGLSYELEDPVLVVPDELDRKPCVAIIKGITEKTDGSVLVTGQKLYRPEETEKEKGGSWESNDARELYYSFDRTEVPAENVMHKCVVHLIPQSKKVPSCRQHPGFIVQNVYDAKNRKLVKLLEVEYEHHRQREIDLLVQKTEARLAIV